MVAVDRSPALGQTPNLRRQVLARPAMGTSLTLAKLPPRDGPHDQERLGTRGDGVGQGSVGRVVREVLRTGEESEKRPAAAGGVVADRAAQHRVAGFEGVEN